MSRNGKSSNKQKWNIPHPWKHEKQLASLVDDISLCVYAGINEKFDKCSIIKLTNTNPIVSDRCSLQSGQQITKQKTFSDNNFAFFFTHTTTTTTITELTFQFLFYVLHKKSQWGMLCVLISDRSHCFVF